MTAIGVILIPQFLAVEAQLAQYLGGIVQQVAVTLIVMLPIIRLRQSEGRRVSEPARTMNPNILLAPK